MKLAVQAISIAAVLAVAGCTTDDTPNVRARRIDDRPQFDREGNPNFDTRGRYQGCHGIGCEVDDPDDDDQTIDDRPQFDREGNPNFDTEGNYQGCHGIGCDVDDPDDADYDDDDD